MTCVIWNVIQVSLGVSPVEVRWTGREAVFHFQWLVVFHIIHQVKVAHFVFICGTGGIKDRCFFQFNSLLSMLIAYPIFVTRFLSLTIVHRAVMRSPYLIGSAKLGETMIKLRISKLFLFTLLRDFAVNCLHYHLHTT